MECRVDDAMRMQPKSYVSKSARLDKYSKHILNRFLFVFNSVAVLTIIFDKKSKQMLNAKPEDAYAWCRSRSY